MRSWLRRLCRLIPRRSEVWSSNKDFEVMTVCICKRFRINTFIGIAIESVQ